MSSHPAPRTHPTPSTDATLPQPSPTASAAPVGLSTFANTSLISGEREAAELEDQTLRTPAASHLASVANGGGVGPPEEELQKFLDQSMKLYEYEYAQLARNLRASRMMCHALSTAWKHQCGIVEDLKKLLGRHNIVIPPQLESELAPPPSFAAIMTAN
ncbi:hypothetical protein EST38_g3096 [Candolleomyces aberdarensis]|uniref:Uncharacterized protein n=1 Tax=Candolleomyces aberdarensis TaxID=2316362 RepID=A0A4Q2DV07_9AGAR|nr:hypothetical protein EST38_g3096 [Candolleomyces aberdarensis]